MNLTDVLLIQTKQNRVVENTKTITFSTPRNDASKIKVNNMLCSIEKHR